MDYFYSIFDNVRYFYSSLNPNILSGAIDVIVVEQPDGRYVSTPFHVRFGKYGVLNNTEKYVDIRINGQEVDFKMKLDVDGVAFFVEETSSGEQVPRYLATSPVRSDANFPQSDDEISGRRCFVDLPRNKESCVLRRRRHSQSLLRKKWESPKSVRQTLRKNGIFCGSLSDTELVKQRNFEVNVKPTPSEWKWGEIPLMPSHGTETKRETSRTRTKSASRSSRRSRRASSSPDRQSPKHVDDSVQVELISAHYKRSLRLSDAQLRALGLQYGANEARFSVTTRFQGTAWCVCQIYLLRWSQQLVISDIDGTITKSDVLGHVFAAIGGTWAHTGVADLFARISANGYQMIYLSSRAIGMSGHTKNYLKSLRQGTKTLPDGPVLLSPTSIFVALRREVIERCPEEFKIRCLMDLKSLFPGRQPFFAGFGNRLTDVKSYRAVDVPLQRIFIINASGVVVRADSSYFTSDYSAMAAITADYMFPPIFKLKFTETKEALQHFVQPEDIFLTPSSNGQYQNGPDEDELEAYTKRSAKARSARSAAKK